MDKFDVSSTGINSPNRVGSVYNTFRDKRTRGNTKHLFGYHKNEVKYACFVFYAVVLVLEIQSSHVVVHQRFLFKFIAGNSIALARVHNGQRELVLL